MVKQVRQRTGSMVNELGTGFTTFGADARGDASQVVCTCGAVTFAQEFREMGGRGVSPFQGFRDSRRTQGLTPLARNRRPLPRLGGYTVSQACYASLQGSGFVETESGAGG